MLSKAVFLGLIVSVTFAVPGFGLEVYTINSDNLSINRAQQVATFWGSVRLKHTDFELYADQIKVFYDANTQNYIKHIDGVGAIKIVTKEEMATADTLHYRASDKIFSLKNNVRIQRSGNTISADCYYYYVQERKSVASGCKEGKAQDSKGKNSDRIKIKINNLEK